MEMRVAAGRWTPKLVVVLVLLHASCLVAGTDLMSGPNLRRMRVRAIEPADVQGGFARWMCNVRQCEQLNLQVMNSCPLST